MKRPKIGNGYDVHALTEGEFITLCGIKIKHNKELVAHSDGDVAAHALCDAILGALALGDIGKHFPDNDQSFKGIDSMILLEKCNNLALKKGYEIGNLDITIAAQAPKLRPHIELMRERLASCLKLNIESVSVKATTTERLGFVGKEEGIAAYASVILFAVE